MNDDETDCCMRTAFLVDRFVYCTTHAIRKDASRKPVALRKKTILGTDAYPGMAVSYPHIDGRLIRDCTVIWYGVGISPLLIFPKGHAPIPIGHNSGHIVGIQPQVEIIAEDLVGRSGGNTGI